MYTCIHTLLKMQLITIHFLVFVERTMVIGSRMFKQLLITSDISHERICILNILQLIDHRIDMVDE